MNPLQKIELPPYAKLTLILLGGVLMFYILSRAATILIPVSFAFLISLLLQPLHRKLLSWKIPRAVSAILSIFLVLAFLATIITFMGIQISEIAKGLPEMGNRFNMMVDNAQRYFESKFGVNQAEQTRYIKQSVNMMAQQGSSVFTNAIVTTTRIVTFIILVVIPLFFFLYYRDFLRTFLLSAVKDTEHSRVRGLISEVEKVVQNYISGLFIVMLILAAMNIIGLKIIGVDYAFFFGITAALLNIIPFIGVVIGSLLPIIYAALTMDSMWAPVAVAGVFWLAQFLEGNIITPNIVGGKVSINPFAAILALFIGGQVWGAAGMILFIPFTGILKVLLDNIDSMKAYGFLLGDPSATGRKKKEWTEDVVNFFKRKFGKNSNPPES